jgi:hypothetical protein
VAVRVFAAELVELGGQELGGLDLGNAVETGHLVERALQCALRRGAVIADDHVDERVVQRGSEGIEQPANVMVGVLHKRGVDLHLTLQHRLEPRVHVIPGRDFRMTRGEHRRTPITCSFGIPHRRFRSGTGPRVLTF